MIVAAEVSCPWCGEYFALAIDTSEGDFDTIVDCEVCCRPMETRSLETMETLARVRSAHRIDASGGLIPLTRDEMRSAWEQWRKIAPTGE